MMDHSQDTYILGRPCVSIASSEASDNQRIIHDPSISAANTDFEITIHCGPSNDAVDHISSMHCSGDKNLVEQSTIIVEPEDMLTESPTKINIHTNTSFNKNNKKTNNIYPVYTFKTRSFDDSKNSRKINTDPDNIGKDFIFDESCNDPVIELVPKLSSDPSNSFTVLSEKTENQSVSHGLNIPNHNDSPIEQHTKRLKLDVNHIKLRAVTESKNREDEFRVAELPAPGSIAKIAPNATLIDLNKIKKVKQNNTPLLIDEVTVMIDDSNTVKVVDYGPLAKPRDTRVQSSGSIQRTLGNTSFTKTNYNKSSRITLSDNSMGATNVEPTYEQIKDSSLSISLECMRQLRVDCNVALVDPSEEHSVYAHRAVLISRSPYFYRKLYLRRKKQGMLYQFCRFTLPPGYSIEAVEEVVSYMYSGSLSSLVQSSVGISRVVAVLSLLEMNDTIEMLTGEPTAASTIVDSNIDSSMDQGESSKDEMDENKESVDQCIYGLPSFFESSITEEDKLPDERKKKRRLPSSNDASPTTNNNSTAKFSSSFGMPSDDTNIRLKSSVQKIVDSGLNPIMYKLEELFDNSTLQTSKPPHHITLWTSDVLLTKLFDNNEITKYFSNLVNEVSETGLFNGDLVAVQGLNYTVENLLDITGFDEAYTKSGVTTDPVMPYVETLTVGDMQIINYTQLELKHINKFVRLIGLYKYKVMVSDPPEQDRSNKHVALLGSLLDDSSSQFQRIIGGFEDNSASEAIASENKTVVNLKPFIKQISKDLFWRTMSDLDARLNVNYQEEIIMHIIVEQCENDKVFPLTIGIFLSKGCSFCRKRECRAEDLTAPISPDNPVCPDRQCIVKNLVCNICNKKMANSKSLARHKYSVHDLESGEATGIYICSHCGDTFSKKWKLNVHEKQHEDKKVQLACHICNKVMRGAIALKKHINMVHETKRQYSCEHCNKMFKRKETLQVHYRIHTGEKPFSCPHCDYSSETKGNLKAHIWRKHKRSLVTTSVGDGGVEASITAPMVEKVMMAGTTVCDGIVTSTAGAREVLDGTVLELANHSNIQDATSFIIS